MNPAQTPHQPAAAPAPRRTAHLDALRVLCTQLIVWHHLAFYGPMSDVVLPHAQTLIEALYDHGRLAVQVFLVMGGYLAARSLDAHLQASPRPAPPGSLWALIGQRYLRLVPPMLLALALAILCAAIARQLMTHEATPAAPTWDQVLAHALLLHNVLDYPGLSAGVWYIAVDFQLYVVLAAWAWASPHLASRLGGAARTWFWGGVATLTALSLLAFNLQSELDIWAIYFFGAYGLGALAAGFSRRGGTERDVVATLALGGLMVIALLVEWRVRILLAGLCATALVLTTPVRDWPRWMQGPLVARLTRISYAQFLVHYPLGLLVNGAVHRFWPDSAWMNAAGMVLAWALSLVGAWLFQEAIDRCAAWLKPAAPPARAETLRSVAASR